MRDASLNLPMYLRGGPRFGECDGCHRATWSVDDLGETCTMPQPDGRVCGGTLQAPVYWQERVEALEKVICDLMRNPEVRQAAGGEMVRVSNGLTGAGWPWNYPDAPRHPPTDEPLTIPLSRDLLAVRVVELENALRTLRMGRFWRQGARLQVIQAALKRQGRSDA